MFTGIVEEIGQVVSVDNQNDLSKVSIKTEKILESAKIGDSISINGVCLTVISIQDLVFTSEIVKETLSKTNLKYIKAGDCVNLERAMRADSRFDGHIVQGHVEGVGKVKKILKDNDSFIISIEIPQSLSDYCIHKGSITINGVSLTIALLEEKLIDIWIIPHTLSHTTFSSINENDYVNIETDIIAKYVEKIQVLGRK